MELGGGANQHGQDNMAQLEHHAHQGNVCWNGNLVCLGEANSGNLARGMGRVLVERMRRSLFCEERNIRVEGGWRVGVY